MARDNEASPNVTAVTPAPSARSQRGLDWFVFFLADVQTSFVPFISVYLTAKQWAQIEIGLVLTVGGLVALLGQIPGGALVDAVRSVRMLMVLAVIAVSAASLGLAAFPVFGVVLAATVLQAMASCLLGPAVAAISLGLVGHDAVSHRLGRNARFMAAGSIVATATMGLWGSLFSNQTVFLVTVALCMPALVAISLIRAEEIDPDRARGGETARPPSAPLSGLGELARNGPLVVFALLLLLFHLANAAMMPQVASGITRQAGEWASALVSACVIVPQAVVVSLAPRIGRSARTIGRRPLMLAGFAALAVRGTLFAVIDNPFLLVAIQVLDGIAGAILSVIVPLVIADLTRGTGHFNLAVGTVGSCMGIGAALSTTLGGQISTAYGSSASFLALAALATLGLLLAMTRMPETRPDKPS